MSEDEYQEKSDHELEKSPHCSQNSDHSDNEFEGRNKSPEKIIEKVIKGIDHQSKGEINGVESSSQEVQHIQNTPEQTEKPQSKYLKK